MIFCHDKIYAKVWEVKQFDKYLELRISTSEKNKNNEGQYINSTWFPRCIGHAFNSLNGKVKEGDRIVITLSKLSNEKYTAKDGTVKSAFRFVILEASIEAPLDTTAAATTTQHTEAAKPENDCPW